MLLLPERCAYPLDNVYHADALVFLAGLADASVDMVFIDPPYGNNNGVTDLAGNRARNKVKGGRTRGEVIPIANDTNEAWGALMPLVLKEINRVLKSDASCCCCCCGGGPNVQFAKLATWLDQYHSFFQAIIWDKSARGDGMGWRYRRNYEFVMVSHKRGGKLAWNEDRGARPNVFNFHPLKEKLHENEKPLTLMEEFIENHTKRGDLIVDCFAGSGATLVAARNLGRRYIGCDLDYGYVQMARKRLALPFTPFNQLLEAV